MNIEKSKDSALLMAIIGLSFLGAYMFLMDCCLVLLYPHVTFGDCVSEHIKKEERGGEEMCFNINFPVLRNVNKTKDELQNWRTVLDWTINIWFLLLVLVQTANIYYLQEPIDKLNDGIEMKTKPELQSHAVLVHMEKHVKIHYPLFLADFILVLFFSYVSIVGDLPLYFCWGILLTSLLCHVAGFLAVLKCVAVLKTVSLSDSDIESSEVYVSDSSSGGYRHQYI